MSDLRISYDEEMVGADHPTKDDTLNRLALAEHNQDGGHDVVGLAVQTGDPGTAAGEFKVYRLSTGLWCRAENDGTPQQLTDELGVLMPNKTTEHISSSHTIVTSASGFETWTETFSEVTAISDAEVVLNLTGGTLRSTDGTYAVHSVSARISSTSTVEFKAYFASGVNGLVFNVEADVILQNLV